ncbi:MAG TPA: hypothetical protein EYP03_00180 [Aquificae bacterium]|nr:hypothetical protein [Aquificota bacterium]
MKEEVFNQEVYSEESEKVSSENTLIPAFEYLSSTCGEDNSQVETSQKNTVEPYIDPILKERIRKEVEEEIKKELEKEYEKKLQEILNEKITALTSYYEEKIKEIRNISYNQGFEEGYKKGRRSN